MQGLPSAHGGIGGEKVLRSNGINAGMHWLRERLICFITRKANKKSGSSAVYQCKNIHEYQKRLEFRGGGV